MRVAVYTVALDEEHFVDRWSASAREADLLLIGDTGSTDKTVERARAQGVEVVPVHITPWRFDDARNALLSHVPKDYDFCIALDMDEILVPGWREALEAVTPGVTRPRYQYTWSWNADGSPGLVYGGDKIHRRSGYRWKHPVHEVLVPYGQQEVQDWIGLEIHHHPDASKSRSQYLPLLEMSVAEDPSDCRNSFYLGRELHSAGRYEDAARELQRYLGLPTATWGAERSAAYRLLAKAEPHRRAEHLSHAVREAPTFREPWVDLALYHYETEDWAACLNAAESALAIQVRPLAYLNEAFAWGALPHDLAAISAFNLGKLELAQRHGAAAVAASPEDERLLNNLAWYSQSIGS